MLIKYFYNYKNINIPCFLQYSMASSNLLNSTVCFDRASSTYDLFLLFQIPSHTVSLISCLSFVLDNPLISSGIHSSYFNIEICNNLSKDNINNANYIIDNF